MNSCRYRDWLSLGSWRVRSPRKVCLFDEIVITIVMIIILYSLGVQYLVCSAFHLCFLSYLAASTVSRKYSEKWIFGFSLENPSRGHLNPKKKFYKIITSNMHFQLPLKPIHAKFCLKPTFRWKTFKNMFTTFYNGTFPPIPILFLSKIYFTVPLWSRSC